MFKKIKMFPSSWLLLIDSLITSTLIFDQLAVIILTVTCSSTLPSSVGRQVLSSHTAIHDDKDRVRSKNLRLKNFSFSEVHCTCVKVFKTKTKVPKQCYRYNKFIKQVSISRFIWLASPSFINHLMSPPPTVLSSRKHRAANNFKRLVSLRVSDITVNRPIICRATL